MTDFWQLDLHDERGDFSCDELFTADEALLHWWTARWEYVEEAFIRGCAPTRASPDGPGRTRAADDLTT
ncbi:hypothetical protein ACFRDV_20250 [Streptomyces fagopyri]|uniref:hypothetical protein n=1 Tax=Streptomyces fagopyri TaxID=2662397 RepID=UPI0036C6B7FF